MMPEEVGSWEGDLGGEDGAGYELCHGFGWVDWAIDGPLFVVELDS